MTRKFARNSLEDAFQTLEQISKDIEALFNRPNTTLPFRDFTNLPPGVEGQLVLAEHIYVPAGFLGLKTGHAIIGSIGRGSKFVTGGWSDLPFGLSFTVGTSHFQPFSIGGLFHPGTTPGVWRPGGGAGEGCGTNVDGRTWQIDIEGTIFGNGPLEILFRWTGDPADDILIFNDTVVDSAPLVYSTTSSVITGFVFFFQSSAFDILIGLNGTVFFTDVT